MISGRPCSCAITATGSMSNTLTSGLPRVSPYTARVLGRIARRKLSGSSGSTNVVSMPRREKPMPSWPTVPPYKVEAATMWSPALRIASSAVICAAMPVAQASAARPPSSDATRSSSTATVGLLMRLYTLPNVCKLNRLAACSAESNTKLVVWWIGVARAPVTGSGVAPAWMARVPKPYSRSSVLISVVQLLRTACRDHLRIHARPVQAAEQARVLDLHAAVHHHVQAGGPRLGGRFLVHHPDLQPKALRTDRDGFVGDRRDVRAAAEAVHHVDLHARFGGSAHAGIAALAQDLRRAGIDRHDAVAVLLHVLGREEAGPVPLGRKPNDREGAAACEDAAQRVDRAHRASVGRAAACPVGTSTRPRA